MMTLDIRMIILIILGVATSLPLSVPVSLLALPAIDVEGPLLQEDGTQELQAFQSKGPNIFVLGPKNSPAFRNHEHPPHIVLRIFRTCCHEDVPRYVHMPIATVREMPKGD